MTENLHKLLAEVQDEGSFRKFLFALHQDWESDRKKEKRNPSSPYGPSANGWENGTIGNFLEAASAWSEDTEIENSNENVWARAAQIIYAGKVYE